MANKPCHSLRGDQSCDPGESFQWKDSPSCCQIKFSCSYPVEERTIVVEFWSEFWGGFQIHFLPWNRTGRKLAIGIRYKKVQLCGFWCALQYLLGIFWPTDMSIMNVYFPIVNTDLLNLRQMYDAIVTSITPDFLVKIWKQLSHWLDECHAINGAHIEQ